MEAAWANAVHAMPCGPFVRRIGETVANDQSPEGGAAWLLNHASDFMRRQGQEVSSPWRAYDLFVTDFEAMDRLWPAFELAAADQPIPADHTLPSLARFMADRLPAVWAGTHGRDIAPVTLAVSLADRIDTLVGMFAAGLKPNGSKDPYALRRAAKEVLQMVLFPVRRLEPEQMS